MRYYSLQHQSPEVSFAEAAITGQAPDKGLYFPKYIPKLSANFIEQFRHYSTEAIGVTVMQPYVGTDMPFEVLEKIVSETIDFPFPLVNINHQIASLELYHGPTLAFKDVGARFMSRCLGYFNRHGSKKITVLVATSGDTGGAVANGFLGVEGVEVIILYPSGRVSPIQELQLTTLGKNIQALEVTGSFDDCQAIVKQAFMDSELNEVYRLTSANSINVARWLPQQLYYFYALQKWHHTEAPVICVPSGNFGNICAGILVSISGLPVKHFLAACNENDVIPHFMQTQQYQPKKAVATVSNAMDVGNPSNFVRILEIYKQQFHQLAADFSSESISDATTIATIARVYQQYNYTLDPHGAVGFAALENYLQNTNNKGIVLETAHPIKFPDTVEKATGIAPEYPEQVQHLLGQQKQSVLISPDFEAVKQWLLSRKP